MCLQNISFGSYSSFLLPKRKAVMRSFYGWIATKKVGERYEHTRK